MSKKILIAEDDRPMASALEIKLNNSGFEAKTVFNGEEAIKELEKEKYDLMLLDIMMPVMNGFEVLEYFREKKITIPVIVSSNLGQKEDIEKAMSLGAKDFFVKSDTPINEVVEHINKILL